MPRTTADRTGTQGRGCPLASVRAVRKQSGERRKEERQRGPASSCGESRRAAAGGERGRGRRGRVSLRSRAAAGATPATAATAHRACGSLNNSHAHWEEEVAVPAKWGPRLAAGAGGNTHRPQGQRLLTFLPLQLPQAHPSQANFQLAPGSKCAGGEAATGNTPAAAAAPRRAHPGIVPRRCLPARPCPAAQPRPAPLGHFPRLPARLPAQERGTHLASGPRNSPPPRQQWQHLPSELPSARRPTSPPREASAAAPSQAANAHAAPAQRPEQTKAPAASPGAEVREAAMSPTAEADGWVPRLEGRTRHFPPLCRPYVCLSVRVRPPRPAGPAHIHDELHLASLRARGSAAMPVRLTFKA